MRRSRGTGLAGKCQFVSWLVEGFARVLRWFRDSEWGVCEGFWCDCVAEAGCGLEMAEGCRLGGHEVGMGDATQEAESGCARGLHCSDDLMFGEDKVVWRKDEVELNINFGRALLERTRRNCHSET